MRFRVSEWLQHGCENLSFFSKAGLEQLVYRSLCLFAPTHSYLQTHYVRQSCSVGGYFVLRTTVIQCQDNSVSTIAHFSLPVQVTSMSLEILFLELSDTRRLSEKCVVLDNVVCSVCKMCSAGFHSYTVHFCFIIIHS